MTTAKPYHHGDLATALREAARAILEAEGPVALSLRAVARRAGVSHAAPYRHYKSREALLADLAIDGLAQLRAEIASAAMTIGTASERIVLIGGAYMRFAARNPGLLKLIFGPDFPNRGDFPELTKATHGIGEEIGTALRDRGAGLAVWAALHGLAMLIVQDVIDLGQVQGGMHVVPSRAEILLRSLIEALKD